MVHCIIIVECINYQAHSLAVMLTIFDIFLRFLGQDGLLDHFVSKVTFRKFFTNLCCQVFGFLLGAVVIIND